MMRSPVSWYVLLVTLCVIGPYLMGVPPRRRRDSMILTATLAFLTWLLGGFAFVRSR